MESSSDDDFSGLASWPSEADLAYLDGDADGDAEQPDSAFPAVVAVLVSAGGDGLERSLRCLVDQDYSHLTVLVIDQGTGPPLAPRIAAVAPRALVRRLDEASSFEQAANDVLATVEGAPFLLLCRDDMLLEPNALAILVAEAFRSNAAILAPKVVDAAHPDRLVDVGSAIDHYGEPFSAIEFGELDQEQHDAVRDVFYVNSSAMLVRADLFGALGGFDIACGPIAALDLSWRARLAGARVIVAPDARAHQLDAGRTELASVRAATAGRVRTLCKAYSSLALIWVLPIAFALVIVEAVVRVAQRRFSTAGALFAGWFDGLGAGSLGAARRATQQLRTVEDHEVRMFMVRGSARTRTFVTRRLHADERLALATVRAHEALDEASGQLRRPETLLVFGVVALLLIGLRSFVSSGIASVGDFGAWRGLHELLHAFGSARRASLLGADASGPPALAIFAALSTALVGDVDLARTLLVVAAVPLGVYGMFRLTRPLAVSAWPAVGASIAYAVNPVLRNSFANGELGALATFAIVPFLFAMLHGPLADDDSDPRSFTRLVGATILTALAAALWPTAMLIPLFFAVAELLAMPFVGGFRTALQRVGEALIVMTGAFVLLLPWSTAYFSGDGGAIGWWQRAPLRVGQILGFHAGPNGAGWLPFGILLAAVLPLIIASGVRWVWAARAWVVAAAALALAYLPQRIGIHAVVPAANGILVLAAFGLAVAIGVGIGAFLAEIRTFLFGFRQAAAIVTAVALTAPIVGLIADLRDGRFGAPHSDWAATLNWMPAEARREGSFRVLWIGDSRAMPFDGVVGNGEAFTLTRDGAGDIRAQWPSTGRGVDTVSQAIALVDAGATARLGHLLAPMGVKYVALVERATPDSTAYAPTPRLAAGLQAQLDLSVLDSRAGLRIYHNDSFVPVRAALPRSTVVPTKRGDPIADALETDLRGASKLGAVAPAGTVLLSEEFSSRYALRVDGKAVARRRAFGWSTAWPVARSGRATIAYHEPFLQRALLGLEAVLWAAAIGGLVMLRRRDRRVRRAGVATTARADRSQA